MPPKGEKEEKEIEVKVAPSEPDPGERQIEIDIETGSEAGKSTKPTFDPEKYQKRMEYQFRQFEKKTKDLERVISDLTRSQTQPAAQAPIQDQPDLDEYDKLAQKDWKAAVRKLAKEEADRQYQELLEKKQAYEKQQAQMNILEKSKALVLKSYPDIDDENSEIARMYQEIINEDQSLLENPNGPEIAMHRMERKFGTQAGLTKPTEVDREVQRRMRINQTPAPQGFAPSSQSRYVLTQNEIDFCKRSNIPFNEYIKMKELDPSKLKEGVEVE